MNATEAKLMEAHVQLKQNLELVAYSHRREEILVKTKQDLKRQVVSLERQLASDQV